jgi:hypothetical protein
MNCWVSEHIDSISLAKHVCRFCGVCLEECESMLGATTSVDAPIPYTKHCASVLVCLLDGVTQVAIEVVDSPSVTMQQWFDCKEVGVQTYEVLVVDVQAAMQSHAIFPVHILCTTTTGKRTCDKCESAQKS